MQQENIDIDVAILTSTVTNEVMEKSLEAGAKFCIEKPINRDTLAKILKGQQQQKQLAY